MKQKNKNKNENKVPHVTVEYKGKKYDSLAMSYIFCTKCCGFGVIKKSYIVDGKRVGTFDACDCVYRRIEKSFKNSPKDLDYEFRIKSVVQYGINSTLNSSLHSLLPIMRIFK